MAMTAPNRDFPPIFDGHEDFITAIKRDPDQRGRDFLSESDKGHVDLPRALRGGLGGCFTSIFLTNEQAELNATGYALQEMNDVYAIADRSDGRFRVCRTVGEVKAAFGEGAFASVFMFEGADPVSSSLKELRVFYEAGLRCLAPVWSRSNLFAHGVRFRGEQVEEGLTEAGRRLVAECNRLGIILDVSHINPAGFWDVLEESKTPVIATHSSVKALSPHVRNLDDEQVRALADQGGTIGVNFATSFLRPDMRRNPDTDLETVVAHFDYLVNLVGDEHVSFGTDFDGADVPACIADAAGLPLVVRAFQRRGWSEARIERICNGNFLRVAREVWGS
jgi:membrane dipeptidase